MIFSEKTYEWKMERKFCSQRGEAKVTKFRMDPAGCVPCKGGVEKRVGTSQTSYLLSRQFFQLLPSSHFARCGYDFVVSVRGKWQLFTFTKVKFLVAGICLAISPNFFNQLICF